MAAHTDAFNLDGLVVVAGFGDINNWGLETLSEITSHIPVVVVSRSVYGPNLDDALRPQARERLEKAGLILKGYETLSPLQARVNLLVELGLERQNQLGL